MSLILLVSDEVADALEEFIREENNYTLRRYRAKAYYSLDCEDGIEHHILFRQETPEELYEKKLTIQQLNRALAKLPLKQPAKKPPHSFQSAYIFGEKGTLLKELRQGEANLLDE